MLLALDTSTPATTVALHDGSAVVVERTTVDAMRHGEVLAPVIEQLLADAGTSRRQLGGIAVGVGPGPFTGLRVGVVTASTLGHVLGIPVYGVCSLDVVAAGVDPTTVADRAAAETAAGEGRARPFLVVTDARRKEVYWARYTDPFTRVDGPHVDRPVTIADRGLVDTPVAGRGAELYPDVFGRPIQPLDPSAGVLAGLVARGQARTLDPIPLYLRRPDARPPGGRKAVSRH